jgi:hypothetical protein
LKKPRPAKPGEVNYAFTDRFTFAHFGIGALYGLLHVNFTATVILAILWEILENPLKVYFPSVFPNATADTLKNSIGDTIAVVLGWYVVQKFFLSSSI